LNSEATTIFAPGVSPILQDVDKPRIDFRFLMRAVIFPFAFTR
jgi:hypothetical protein